jgi:hypothetical protein
MNIFHEYLDDWEFDARWRPFVTRLAEICDQADGATRKVLEECTIYDRPAREHLSAARLLIWVDVSYPDRNHVALTLAGLVDETGMRCGTVSSHCPDDARQADLTWHYLAVAPDADPAELAEPLSAWLTEQAQRPVEELLARENPFHHRSAGQLAAHRSTHRS